MQIDVQALGFELTPALRSHAVRRLHFALGRSEAQVSRLSVRLSDLNGPRGGEDKRCQVRITLTDAPEVVSGAAFVARAMNGSGWWRGFPRR